MKIDDSAFRAFMRDYRNGIKRAIPLALNKAGEKARSIILTRTRKGVGLNGRFARYSREYAKAKSKAGLGSFPNLRYSGKMLDSIDVTKKNNETVLVHFTNKKEEKKAKYNSKKRPFFGIRPEETKGVTRAFYEQFMRRLP